MLVNMTFLTIYIVTTRWMYVGMWWNKAFCWQNIRSSSLSMVMEWHSYRSMFVSMQLVRYMKVRSICERYDDYAMMIWWWCRSCFQYTFMVARDMNEVAHAISPSFAICILYPCYWWDLKIWMYGSFTSCYTQQLFTLGILCYNCKYRSISRDKIISNWSNNQPTLNDSRILTCLTWFMPLGSMYNVYDSTINFGCGTDN